MSDGFRVRLARPHDVPALQELIAASVRGLSAGFYTPRQAESGIRYVFGVDSQLVADGTYYVIEDDEGLAAAGGWSRRRTLYGGDQMKDVEDPVLDPTREPARIRAFFVAPRCARRGLGTWLYETCAAAAREAGFTSLELMATLPGVPLYRVLGFEALETHTPVLPDGVELPVVRMRRQISPPAGTSPDGR